MTEARTDRSRRSIIATYLLTWNRALWPWHELQGDIRTIERQGYCSHVWGCGVTRRIVPGDRVFLIKVGREPRGIVGSGWVVTPVYEELYTDHEGHARAARCIKVHFDALLDPDQEIFPRAWLQMGIYTRMHWSPQASGVRIPAQVAAQLEEDWARFLDRPAPTSVG